MRHSCKRLKRRKVYFNKFVVYRIAVGRKLCPIINSALCFKKRLGYFI